MGRREDIKGHHTIRHTFEPARGRGIPPLLMMMLLFAFMMATVTLNTSETSKSPDMKSPEWQQMLSTAAVMSEGRWGPELLDDCFLLAEGFAEDGQVSASKYMLMLASGAPPDGETDGIISDISADGAEAKIYRRALEASYKNKLQVEERKAASQSRP